MRIGVIGVQGDVVEHVEAIRRALETTGRAGESFAVRSPVELARADAVTIPGGESTTISKLIVKFGIFDRVVRRAREGMPILGTCAGCILLAKDAGREAERTGTKLLGLMDMAVDRNAFGRQRESFEADLEIPGFSSTFRGVFIRAPLITRTWGDCIPLARLGGGVVLAKQESLVASAFHPELSEDPRVHEIFFSLVQDRIDSRRKAPAKASANVT